MTITVPNKRLDGRGIDQVRPVTIEPNVNAFAEGSALIKIGNTHVLCTATVDEAVPRWMVGKGSGWVTAEYSLLPRSTQTRTDREAVKGKQGGRTVEIQRLIGRSLRAAVDMQALGERQVILDCDVLQADGGTRCAAITGAWVALELAFQRLVQQKRLKRSPMLFGLAAVSVGVVNGVPVLDLDYAEDSRADVDANVVMTNRHEFVELGFTSEHAPFPPETMQRMLSLATTGLDSIFTVQREAVAAGL